MKIRNKWGVRLAVVAAGALAFSVVPAAAQADVVLGDGDNTYAFPTNGPQSVMDFGEVCAGGSYDLTAGIVVRRSGANTARIWTNGSTLTFAVTGASTGLSATTPASAALPADWETRSTVVPASDLLISSSTVTLTAPATLGAGSGSVVFSSTGPAVAGGTWPDDDLMEVEWTVVECADIELTKSVDAHYVVVDDSIPYVYEVENTGSVDLENVSVVDDKCSPVEYSSGNTGNPNVLSVGETWMFTCGKTATLAQASTLLTNTAEVTAYTGAGAPVTDEDSFTLQALALRKLVAVYWDYINYIPDLAAGDVQFMVDLTKDSEVVGSEPLSKNSPLYVWLTPGTWSMQEQTPPPGYRVFDGRGSWNVGVVPSANYLDNTFINGSDFDLAISKSGPMLAKVGEDITYNYEVTNTGPAAVTPIVTDDICNSVEYANGDDGDGLIQASETWTYTCTTTTTQADWAAQFPAGDLTNTARVIDDEADDLAAPYGLFGGDTDMTNNADSYSLYPFVLRKDVRLYNDGASVAFDDPYTEFGVKASTTGFYRDMTVSESEPLYLWLADGTWTFKETSYPKGYYPKEDYYLTGITHITGQFPPDYYPDWTFVNTTWTGCSHGYWKNHPTDWPAGYFPTQTVGMYFPGSAYYDSTSLGDALAFTGGGGVRGAERILLMQAVAALLNEAEYGTQFGPYTSLDQLKSAVNSALASGDRTTMIHLADTLDYWNNGVCR